MIVPTATKVGPVATAAHRRCARTRQAQNANKDWIRISGLDSRDIDSHSGGYWKGFSRLKNGKLSGRTGTYTKDLKRIGK